MKTATQSLMGRILVLSLWLAAGSLTAAHAQVVGLGINPARVEVEMAPGQERTVMFEVESPPSQKEVRGRMMLNLTDWNINPDASLVYDDPGKLPNSASSWIVFSPAAFTIASGQKQNVRVTVRVPAGTLPGVYRAGIFIQERPPTVTAPKGQGVVVFRFRYVFIMYVIIPPVAAKGELQDASVQKTSTGLRLFTTMKNAGTLHVRPGIDWTILDANEKQVAEGHAEPTVLLPGATVRESFALGADLKAGEYLLRLSADFRDGQPLQAIKRKFEVPASATTPPGR